MKRDPPPGPPGDSIGVHLDEFLEAVGSAKVRPGVPRQPVSWGRKGLPAFAPASGDLKGDAEAADVALRPGTSCEKAWMAASLAILASDACLLCRMHGLVLRFIQGHFPLTDRPLEPLPIGERGLAALILVHNLAWHERLADTRGGIFRWRYRLRERKMDERALRLARPLLAVLDWCVPPDPSGELILLHVLLDACLPLYLRGRRAGDAGPESLQNPWRQLWHEVIARSPITRLVACDLLDGCAEVKGGEADTPAKAIGPVTESRQASQPLPGGMWDSGWYDWRGLDRLAARPDFDVRTSLLQRLADSATRMDARPGLRDRLLHDAATALRLRDL
ncbi:MAG: hypothetical protein HYU36_15075 [Planctomycetes bacterium]|nr:hypothetical protein [Planctomycetota bacterium]